MSNSKFLRRRGFSLIEVVVALAILGIAVVAVIQLFSISLRTIKKSEDYSKALVFGRSILDEAYVLPEPSKASGTFTSGELVAEREVALVSSEEGVEVYEITVTVIWPENQSLSLKGKRILYEKKK